MKTHFEFRRIMRESAQMYFAPLTGAVKGIAHEMRRVEKQIASARASREQKKKGVTNAP